MAARKSSTAPRRARKPDLADQLYDQASAPGPAISQDDADAVQRFIANPVAHQAMGIALHALTMPSEELFETVARDRDLAVTWAAGRIWINDYAERIETLAALLQQAQMRIIVGLTGRADMKEVMAAGDPAVYGQ